MLPVYALSLLLATAAGIPADFHLALKHGGCMGVCPASSLTIDHAGNAKLSAMTGFYERRLSQVEMQQLVAAIRRADFFENPFPLDTNISNDSANDAVQIRMDGRERTVSTNGYLGDEIGAFIKSLDTITRGKDGAWKTIVSPDSMEILRIVEPRGCRDADECAAAAKRLARESLLLVSYSQRMTAPALQVRRDGHIRLYRPGYAGVFEARLTGDRLGKLRASLPLLNRHALRSEPPDDAIVATVSVPAQTSHHVFRLDLRASAEAAAMLDPFLDLRSYVDRSSIVRIRVESSGCDPRRERWPAEDLVPLAEVEKRTFTAAEWDGILGRIWTKWNEDADEKQLDHCVPSLDVTVSPH